MLGYIGGNDYGFGPYTVTFPAKEVRAVLNISIIDDKILEMNETFNLIVDESSLPNIEVLAFPPYDSASVIIVEDDKSNY